MSKTVIRVENVSKQYRLGSVYTGTLGHDMNRWWHRVRGKEDPYLKIGEVNDRTAKATSDYVWALRNVNFEVKQGEVLGIIGRNGAGKSTLLKILSRTTAPTTGRLKIRGRVASLLEVGTGFHPELTGRENVFLNGTILGMTKQEISRKFDEIVDFAGVERYVDTPVKRYSSGMYVRLAFAVAAHLEPEILIVDEVLAVGDTEFQKKALGKIKDVSSNDGRTVLIVSHSMQAISALAERIILMQKGLKTFEGESVAGIKKYLESFQSSEALIFRKPPSAIKPLVTKVELHTSVSNNIQFFGDAMKIDFEITTPIEIRDAVFSFQIINSEGIKVVHELIKNSERQIFKGIGRHRISCFFPAIKLYPDRYRLIIHLSDHFTKTKYETIIGICPFDVQIQGVLREYYWKSNEAIYVEEANWLTE